MKKHVKFIVAIVGMTLAVIGTTYKATAKGQEGLKECKDGGVCGTTPDNCTIVGQAHTI